MLLWKLMACTVFVHYNITIIIAGKTFADDIQLRWANGEKEIVIFLNKFDIF